MNFLKDIFLGAIKGILSLGIALIMLLIFFSIIGALFSPDTEEEVVVSDNSLLYIDNLTLIGDRDTKADELNFDFEIPQNCVQKFGKKLLLVEEYAVL